MLYCLAQRISVYRQIRRILSVGKSVKAAPSPPVTALNWLGSLCGLLRVYSLHIISICTPCGSAEKARVRVLMLDEAQDVCQWLYCLRPEGCEYKSQSATAASPEIHNFVLILSVFAFHRRVAVLGLFCIHASATLVHWSAHFIFLVSSRSHGADGDGRAGQPRNRFCALGHDWHRLRSLSGSFVLKQDVLCWKLGRILCDVVFVADRVGV